MSRIHRDGEGIFVGLPKWKVSDGRRLCHGTSKCGFRQWDRWKTESGNCAAPPPPDRKTVEKRIGQRIPGLNHPTIVPLTIVSWNGSPARSPHAPQNGNGPGDPFYFPPTPRRAVIPPGPKDRDMTAQGEAHAYSYSWSYSYSFFLTSMPPGVLGIRIRPGIRIGPHRSSSERARQPIVQAIPGAWGRGKDGGDTAGGAFVEAGAPYPASSPCQLSDQLFVPFVLFCKKPSRPVPRQPA